MRRGKLFLALILVESFIIIIRGIGAYYRVSQSKQEIGVVEERLNAFKLENERLKKEEKDSKNPFYLEKLAREKLGLARKDEIIYKILPSRKR